MIATLIQVILTTKIVVVNAMIAMTMNGMIVIKIIVTLVILIMTIMIKMTMHG